MAGQAVALPPDAVDVAGGGLPPDAVDVPKEQGHSTFTDALKEYWGKVNPLAAGNAIAQAAQHPIEAVKGYAQQTTGMLNDAESAFKKGNYAEGIRHGLGFLLNGIPGIGSAIDEAGNKAQAGQYAQAAADTAALATNLAAAKYTPAAAHMAGEAVQGAVEAAPAAARAVARGALRVAAEPEVGVVAGAGIGSSVGHPVIGAMMGRAASAHAAKLLGRLQEQLKVPVAEAPVEAAAEPSRIIQPEAAGSVPRSAERQAIVDELNKAQPAHAAPEKVAESNSITNPQVAENAPQISGREAGNRSKLAQDLAEFLHSEGNGISHADALRMGPDQWKLARSGVRQSGKASVPSSATVQLALEHLKALEEAKGTLAQAAAESETAPVETGLRGRSLDIAQKLAQEMNQ